VKALVVDKCYCMFSERLSSENVTLTWFILSLCN
jgi:hypothetical protein